MSLSLKRQYDYYFQLPVRQNQFFCVDEIFL